MLFDWNVLHMREAAQPFLRNWLLLKVFEAAAPGLLSVHIMYNSLSSIWVIRQELRISCYQPILNPTFDLLIFCGGGGGYFGLHSKIRNKFH